MTQTLARYLVELLYPSNIYCISCHAIIDNTRPYALCDACVRLMKWANGRSCSKCGKSLQEGYLPSLCTECRTAHHLFEKAFACVEYGRAEKGMIHHFKYKEKAYYGRKMAELMADRIAPEDLSFDFILPVPMYKKKEKKRGYNQAAVLAMFLSKNLGVPYHSGILRRTADTAPMSSLSGPERRLNLEGAFDLVKGQERNLEGKTLLLIDDVYTTGSTANACVEVLQRAGAEKVYVLVFATGANLLQER